MFAAIALVSLLALAQAGYGQSHQEEDSDWIEEEVVEQGIPARGRGDIEFHLDSVSFLGSEGQTAQEFFLEVPRSQLVFSELDEGYEAVVRLELMLKSTETGATAKDERVVRIHAATLEEAAREDLAAVLISRFTLKPGTYEYEARVTDLQAKKWEIVSLIRRARKSGTVEGTVEVKDLAGGLRLADVLLAREVRPLVSPSPYSRGDLGIIPNPSHGFGLFQPTLRAYVEAYPPAGKEGQSYTLRYAVISSEGEALATQTFDVKGEGEQWGQVAEFDLSEIPGGTYTFKVEVSSEAATVVSETPMDILWDTASWIKPEGDLIQEMSLALTQSELLEFESMSKGEREVFLREFWNRMDQTPGTARNEIKEEFERRIAHANSHYSETDKGVFTDRGRIYIRYGEPDDIEVQVMPGVASSLDWVIEEKVDAGSMDAEMMRQSGRGGDQRSYEIWKYNLRGYELFPHLARTPKRQIGLEFIFVDEDGYGNFTLEHRNDF